MHRSEKPKKKRTDAIRKRMKRKRNGNVRWFSQSHGSAVFSHWPRKWLGHSETRYYMFVKPPLSLTIAHRKNKLSSGAIL